MDERLLRAVILFVPLAGGCGVSPSPGSTEETNGTTDTSPGEDSDESGAADETTDTETTTGTGGEPEPPVCESSVCSVPGWVSPLQVHPSVAWGDGVNVRDCWSDGIEDWALLITPSSGTEPGWGISALQRWRGPFEMLWEVEVPANAWAFAVDVESARVVAASGPPLKIHSVSMEGGALLDVTEVPDWEPVAPGMAVLENAILLGGRSTNGVGAISHIEGGEETWRVVDPGGIGPLEGRADLVVVDDVIFYCAHDRSAIHVLGFDASGSLLWHWENPNRSRLAHCKLQPGNSSVAIETAGVAPAVHVLSLTGEVWSETVREQPGTNPIDAIAAVAPGEGSVWVAAAFQSSTAFWDPPVELRAVAPGASDCCATPVSDHGQRPYPTGLIRFGNEAALIFAEDCREACQPVSTLVSSEKFWEDQRSQAASR